MLRSQAPSLEAGGDLRAPRNAAFMYGARRDSPGQVCAQATHKAISLLREDEALERPDLEADAAFASGEGPAREEVLQRGCPG